MSKYEINIASIYGAAAVLGHVFPIYINFKGGKAVATSAGMIFAIEPWVAVGVIVLFLIIFLITRYVSLSSTIAASAVLLYFIIRVFLEHELFNLATRIMDLVIITLLATLIFVRHKANYKRLKMGTELKFMPKAKNEKN